MLKGHVFKKQIFGNQIFALFINTFLNGKNGICGNYKNGMSMTNTKNTVTINGGAVCIQGRFLEEDTDTTITAGTDNAYCSLVIEIDLDKENTETEFVQASYKIVKGINNYPYLTYNDIVKNNSGIYQYELARFKTNVNGISDFQDRRTFLDFDSIYSKIQEEYREILTELEQEFQNVKDASAYVLKSNFAKIEGTALLKKDGKGNYEGDMEVEYPNGFSKDNTIVLNVATASSEAEMANMKSFGSLSSSSTNYSSGICEYVANMRNGIITMTLVSKGNGQAQSIQIKYEIYLMKI